MLLLWLDVMVNGCCLARLEKRGTAERYLIIKWLSHIHNLISVSFKIIVSINM